MEEFTFTDIEEHLTYAGAVKRPRMSAPPLLASVSADIPPRLEKEVPNPTTSIEIASSSANAHATPHVKPPTLMRQLTRTESTNNSGGTRTNPRKGSHSNSFVVPELKQTNALEGTSSSGVQIKKRISINIREQQKHAKSSPPTASPTAPSSETEINFHRQLVKKRLEIILNRTKTTFNQQEEAIEKAKKRDQTPSRSRTVSRGVIIQAQVKILTVWLTENPNPTPSAYLEVSNQTGLEIKKIKAWARKHSTIGAPDSGFSPDSRSHRNRAAPLLRVSAGNHSNINVCNDSVQQRLPTTKQCVTNKEESKRQSVVTQPKLKFLKHPSERINDISMIEADLRRVKDFSLEDFRFILRNSWQTKVNRILNLIKNEEYQLKSMIYKEAIRIKDIASKVDPFSVEQQQAVTEWTNGYLDEIAPMANTSKVERLSLRNAIDQVVMPWIKPFFYGRIVKQGDYNLSLMVALHDFCKVSDSQNHGQNFDWKLPTYLNTEI